MMATASTPLWTAADAAAATGGNANGDWQVGGISIDTRTILPGDLFAALKGPNHDGHDYVRQALEKGAAAAMVDHTPKNLDMPAPLLTVDDAERGLWRLAAAARARSDAKIGAVTGSVGKTGTKELLAAALGSQGKVTATAGNLNNHLGLPLSLARMPANADYGVFEMGMNHAGEISPLSELAKPHVAMITTIAPVHIEYFENLEGIADAKAEIFDGLVDGGTAVISRDTPFFDRLSAAAKARGAKMIWGFGVHSFSNARLVASVIEDDGMRVEASVGSQHLKYRLKLRGKHWALNSLGVLAAAFALGADLPAAAEALGKVEPSKGRGRTLSVTGQDGAFTIIDETYNASPVAVRAAFEVLAGTKPGRGGRRIVVLGDMLELGEESRDSHIGLAEDIIRHDFDLVFVCGRHMPMLLEELPADRRAGRAEDSAALSGLVAAQVRAGDLVLVKGSAGARMGAVVEALSALAVDGEGKGA